MRTISPQSLISAVLSCGLHKDPPFRLFSAIPALAVRRLKQILSTLAKFGTNANPLKGLSGVLNDMSDTAV